MGVLKRFLEELKAARKIEWLLALLAIAVLLLTRMGDGLSTASYQTDQEKRLGAILSRIDGAGRVEVMISEGEDRGVLIVAEGAHDLHICLQLQYAARTLLGVEASMIEIMPYRD